MKGSMITIRMTQIVEANRGEADKVFATHRGRGRVPINQGRVRKLVDEGIRSSRL